MGDRDKWERDDEMPRRQRSLTFSGPSRGSEGRAPSDRYRRYLISNFLHSYLARPAGAHELRISVLRKRLFCAW
jgi:hypothetical protein